MDDILKRLGVVESSVAAVAGDVREIKGILPSLATKSEVERVRTEVEKARAELGTGIEKVRTEVADVKGMLNTKINALESSMIKWFIGTAIAIGALSFSIAKFVH